jgi:hypothetical protein
MGQGDGHSARPHKPRPFVLAQSDFVPLARGRVWDLRRAAEGVIEPLDFTARPATGLNIALLTTLLAKCPDRELVENHLVYGVDYKADLPLHAVFLPHMASLAANVDLVQAEIERLAGNRWHELFADTPFLPMRISPNGAVVRKLERLRPRRVENASADGSGHGGPLVDRDGVRVESLNFLVGIHDVVEAEGGSRESEGATSARHDGEPELEGHSAESLAAANGLSNDASALRPKWPKERKPTVLDKVHDLAVLQFAARVFKEDLVGFVTDFKDYFNQFPVSAKYLWANIVHWRGLLGIGGEDLGCFVSEQRLGFGMSASSNICQRFAHALAEIFRIAFDREEEELFAAETDQTRRSYTEARRKLGPGQHRLFEITIYTDDPFFACIAVERLMRALKLWHRITKAAGLELAIPAKRQCGAEVRWLGVEFLLTAGVHFLNENKRLRMIHELLPIAAGEPTVFSTYQSLTSFLSYLRPLVLHLNPTIMYSIYGPYRRGRDGRLPTPATIVRADEEGRLRFASWLVVLRGACGSFFSAVKRARPPPNDAVEGIAWMTDAAIEEEDVSGLGGFLAGLHWHMPLVGDERLLPISVAEFIAVSIGFMVFAPFVGMARPTAYSDSLNSVDVLLYCSAISPLMQYTHRKALEVPEYARLAVPGTVVHCFGPANPCADAVSRGRFELLTQLCSQLGIAPVRLEVPPAARALLDDVVNFARRNGLLTAGPRRRLHSTSVELGAAAQVANGFGHRGTDFGVGGGPVNNSRRQLHSTSVELGAAAQVANGFGHRGMALASKARPERLASSQGSSMGAVMAHASRALPDRLTTFRGFGVHSAIWLQRPADPERREATVASFGARSAGGAKPERLASSAEERERWKATTSYARTRCVGGTRSERLAAGAEERQEAAISYVGTRYAGKPRPERLAVRAEAVGLFGNEPVGKMADRVQPHQARWARIDNLCSDLCLVTAYEPRKRNADERGECGKQGDTARFKRTHGAASVGPLRVREGRPKGQARLRQAAAARADQMVEGLVNDPSPLALRPDNPSRLYSLCTAQIAATATVPAVGTLSADGTAWRRWVSYCDSLNTPPLRTAEGEAVGNDARSASREAILQSGFLIFLASVVEPRSSADAAAKPQSLFNNLLAVRRVHQRLMVDFRITRGTTLLLKAQVRAFIKENGPEALLPARKEPLDASQLRQLFSLGNGIAIGGRALDWGNFFFISYKALLCTGLAAAFRKAELCLPDGVDFSLGRLSVASVSWVIAGTAVQRATNQQLRSLALGDYCVLKPPLCKNDPFGLHFGTKPIWLPVGDRAANAARALAAVFLACPTYPEHPAETPLFRTGIEGAPLRHREADLVLRHLLMAAFPRADVSRWSMHSLRIGAASALLAAGASPALIQAICRWRSAKSVEIYARMGPEDYGRYVLQIERQVVDAVSAQRVLETRIDYDNVVAFFDGMGEDAFERA